MRIVIASRRFDIASRNSTVTRVVTIVLFAPINRESMPDQWDCQYDIVTDSETVTRTVSAGDSLQALSFGLKLVSLEISNLAARYGDLITWQGENEILVGIP